MLKMKKTITVFCILTMILSMFSCVNAEENALVQEIATDNATVTVSGTAAADYVNIFLLNPGKAVADLNAAKSAEDFNAAINHMNTLTSVKNKDYSYTFNIKNFALDTDYLLYVKSGETAETKTVRVASKIYVYVSATGSANGDGSRENPFPTIEKARNAVRKMQKNQPIDIIIGGGVYKVSSTITLNANDSGKENAPVTYKAAEGEKVVLTGAKQLDTSKFKKVTDASILNRVYPEAADKLVEIDLSEQGISKDLVDYTANLAKTWGTKPVGVYLNDVYQNVARWPDSGYKTITKIPSDGILGLGKDEYVTIDGASGRNSWATADNMFVEGYLGNDWCAEWIKVSEVDGSNKVKLADSPYYDITKGQRIAVINLLEELDTPGEWYINADTMKMYYYPPHTLTQNDKFEIAVLTGNIMQLTDANYINIEGISFEKTANDPTVAMKTNGIGGGLTVLRTDNVNIKNCKFTNIGTDGIALLDAQNVKVDRCYIYNTGFNGILVNAAGNIQTLESGNVTVSNCYIAKTVRDLGKTDASAIYLDKCVGVTVENNVMRDTKNSAVLYVHSCLNTIKNNEIYNSVNETTDAGAIYAGRTFVNYGNVIENNYFHDIGAGLTSEVANAIFFDDGHSGNTVKNNVIDMGGKTKTAGVKINGGRDNVISGNAIVNAATQVAQQDLSSLKNINSDFFKEELFQSFKYATSAGWQSEAFDAAGITETDWLAAYKTAFPEIMTNYDNLKNKKYTRENTVSDTKNTYSESDIEGMGISTDMAFEDSEKEFDLLYPCNGASVSNSGIVLKWSLSPFADKYVYEVATDPNFANIAASGETKSQINSVELADLNKDTVYYWRVQAVNTSHQLAGNVYCNNVFSFKTGGSVSFGKVTVSGSSITCTVSNSTSSQKTVSVISAVKDSDGKLVSVCMKPVTVDAGKTNTAELTCSGKDENTGIELYIWQSATDASPVAEKRNIK